MLFSRSVLLAAALAASTSAVGQVEVPGLPVRSVDTTGTEVRPGDPAERGPSQAGPGTDIVPDALLHRLEAALEAMPQAPAGDPLHGLRPPPPEVVVEPGTNHLMLMRLGDLNRLRTPFRRPTVRTSSTAEISIEGHIIYVASATPQPVVLYIMEDGDKDMALSLTLLPRGIPPIDVNLLVEGYEPPPQQVSNETAAQLEMQQPYVQTLRRLFRTLALGQVPEGYGFSEVRGRHPLMPACRFPQGIETTVAQVMEGSAIIALVVRVENRGRSLVELEEERCNAPGVLGVAAWPERILGPGDQTELYVAIRRPEPSRTRERPAVLVGAR